MAQFDVFHQLHCLNSLRKVAYPDYYGFTKSKSKHPFLWAEHLNHCVDILMQTIMCHADTEIFTLQWMETQTYPFPDFSLNRKCKNFGAFIEFRDKNGVDLDKWIRMVKPAGVNQVPAPDEYYQVFGGRRPEESVELPA